MSEIAITSLENSIPWNIRASADNTHNINEGIIHYSSMTIQTLRININATSFAIARHDISDYSLNI